MWKNAHIRQRRIRKPKRKTPEQRAGAPCLSAEHRLYFMKKHALYLCSLYAVPHAAIDSIIGRMDSPISDRAYSTLGGTSA